MRAILVDNLLNENDTGKNIFAHSMDVVYYIKEVVEKYSEYETESIEIPSAPDTSKFKAAVSGKIVPIVNELLRGGYYGFDRLYLLGVKIGGNVDRQIAKEIKNEIEGILTPYVNKEKGIYYNESSGTNYNTIGLVSSKFKFADHVERAVKEIFEE